MHSKIALRLVTIVFGISTLGTSLHIRQTWQLCVLSLGAQKILADDVIDHRLKERRALKEALEEERLIVETLRKEISIVEKLRKDSKKGNS